VAALFSNLHDVAQVLSEHIHEEAGISDVQPGVPRDVASTTVAAARLTFLYATPQPGHRNDPVERRPDGSRRFPPLSLSCFYVVTTSGADNDDPIAAHHALGRIMTLYHDQPVLRLPLSDNPGADPDAFSPLGEGALNVVQAPIAADQVDKIWTSFDLPLQPWALFEVSPVQLVSPREDLPPAPVVAPGGIGLDVRAGTRPLVLRVTPEVVRPLGRARIDALLGGALDGVTLDRIDVPAGSPLLTAAATGSPALLELTGGGLEGLGPGGHQLTVRAAGIASRRGVLRIAEPGAPCVDALPGFRHDPADDLVLTGANLGAAEECVVWPDAGLALPTDVHRLPLSAAGATSVTVPAAEIAGLPPSRGPWRLALRIGAQAYTPPVVLELSP
jgi:hypothetical protein